MFAAIAAILFGLALLFELLKTNLGDTITLQVLTTAGLMFLALHFAYTRNWRGRR